MPIVIVNTLILKTNYIYTKELLHAIIEEQFKLNKNKILFAVKKVVVFKKKLFTVDGQ